MLKASQWMQTLSIVTVPTVITVVAFIVGIGLGFHYHNDSYLISLPLCGLFSSSIPTILAWKSMDKFYNQILVLGQNNTSDDPIFDNKQFKQIYLLVKSCLNKLNCLEQDAKVFNEEINTSFNALTSLSKKIFIDISDIFQSLDDIAIPVNSQADELQIGSNMVNVFSEYLDLIHDNYSTILTHTDEINSLSKSGFNSFSVLQGKFQATYRISEEIFSAIEAFTKQIQRIDSLANIIWKIGKETKLLALNASIEAARAGEAGRGFLVIADDVTKLSNQSNENALHIRELIDNISQQYRLVTSNINELKISIDEQNNSVIETDMSFNNISRSIFSITDDTNSVNTALHKLQSDKDRLLKLILDVAEMSQKAVVKTENLATIIAYHVNDVTETFKYVDTFVNSYKKRIS